ncbi:UDP-glucose--hexose-1-phosphate uridylyltransferase [Lentibacillus saliphilus]|uniref:UDP-glucose--hexose-1-phosphate uridylyltransferase n=1 Tax=Lentibacillus saliphilus TaxID=2737028 RepID=UPI001C30FC36|nr:UDP-glucose--hexose-1-phosphate uridylyltransferase [Lentibacillus saliphilus]
MIHQHIAGLIERATDVGLIEEMDHVYVRNQLFHMLDIKHVPEHVPNATNDSIPNILEAIVAYAIEHDVIEDVFDDKEMFMANVMNIFMPHPSTIHDTFYKKYDQSPREATDYFYHLSKHSNYIQMNRIQKNVHFKANTVYGELDITINLSKPEKDPEQIKREREMKTDVNYPKCVLCKENEGYVGRIGYPARANHRVIQVPLQGENWYLQYSPYVYYNEHSILLCEEHRNMKIDRTTFARLLAFIEQFPHYFIGSNADLPIVGGSILSHDHYQAGHYEFAMTRAKQAFAFEMNGFPNVTARIIEWPLSVMRLQCRDQHELVAAADHVLAAWQHWSDPDAEIAAFTGDTPHNTITPIARMRDGQYELDLVLRNNRTSDEHPMGIFHPHEDVQHIKKENIGLIEVMGLAVLPARLKAELEEVKHELLGRHSDVPDYHQAWTNELKAMYGTLKDDAEADAVIEKELGNKFARVLEDAGVFKNDAAFKRFIQHLNDQ